jgi:hypothetical protein
MRKDKFNPKTAEEFLLLLLSRIIGTRGEHHLICSHLGLDELGKAGMAQRRRQRSWRRGAYQRLNVFTNTARGYQRGGELRIGWQQPTHGNYAWQIERVCSV